MTKVAVILVAGVDYVGPAEREEEFDEWYTAEHAPYVLELGGVEATRYHHLKTFGGASESAPPKYLAIYGFDTHEAFERFSATGFDLTRVQRREHWSDDEFKPRWAIAYEVVTEVG